MRNQADELKNYYSRFRENDYKYKLNKYNELIEEINRKHKSTLCKVFGDDSWKDVIGRFLGKNKIENKEILKSRFINSNSCEFSIEEYLRLSRIIKEGKSSPKCCVNCSSSGVA